MRLPHLSSLAAFLLALAFHAHAKEETFKSDEFGIMAIFPGEVEVGKADYSMGTIGNFTAASEKPLYLAQIGVNISPPMGEQIAAGKFTAKQMLEAMAKTRCKEGQGLMETLKTSWGTWGIDKLVMQNYSWESVGFVKEGVKAYHMGKAIIRKDRYYSIQITYFEKDLPGAQAALDRLMMSFGILPDKAAEKKGKE